MRVKSAGIVSAVVASVAVACSSGHSAPPKPTGPTTTVADTATSATGTSAGATSSVAPRSTTTLKFKVGGGFPTLITPASFACDTLSGRSPAGGKALITVAQINGLAGAKVQSATSTRVGSVLRCAYAMSDGGSLLLSIDTDVANSTADFNTTLTTAVSLGDRGCATCKLTQLVEPDHYGDHEYLARTKTADVVGVISGHVYFEFTSPSIRRSLLEIMAETVMIYG